MGGRATPDGSSRTALLDAAVRLMSERPPSTVTGRELAEAAGVNYGLVHYYFDSAEDLLREARRHHGERLVADLMAGGSRPVPMGRAVADREVFGFAAHVALDGGPDGDGAADRNRPVFDAMLRLADESDPEGDPVHHRAVVVALVLLQLGWPVFVEHNARSIGLDFGVDGPAIRDRYFDAVRSLYRSVGVEVDE